MADAIYTHTIKETVPYEDGTIVLLRSGGPLMTVDNSDVVTVDGVRVDSRMCCWYFDGGQVVELQFDMAALIEVTPEMVHHLDVGDGIPGYHYGHLTPVNQEPA